MMTAMNTFYKYIQVFSIYRKGATIAKTTATYIAAIQQILKNGHTEKYNKHKETHGNSVISFNLKVYLTQELSKQ